jgi:hypothetical protein
MCKDKLSVEFVMCACLDCSLIDLPIMKNSSVTSVPWVNQLTDSIP